MRAFVVVVAGIVAGASLYVGLIQAGALRNPFAPVLQGDIKGARSDRPGLRVLFVGNSMTYYNAMPQMVEELASGDPGAEPLFAVSYTRPGWTLEGAAADRELTRLLRDVRWDDVVLQENSTRALASDDWLRHQSVPYAQQLEHRIRARGARALLYMTWSSWRHEDLASLLHLPAVPIGPAFDEARWRRPDLELLMADQHHPNRAGSYLAACIFYATLTKRDPARSSFSGGVARRDARFLQHLAAELT